MSFGSAPKAPDPQVLAAQQAKLNQQSQRGSMIDQDTPLGSVNYTPTGIDPITGAPTYKATSQLSAQQQQLLNILQGTQLGTQNTASNLWNSSAGTYSTPQNFDATAQGLTGQMMDLWSKQMNPTFAFQTDHLDTKLRNQGLLPGTPAYDQAMRTMQQNQNQSVAQFLANIEPEAYKQAIQNYQLPFQTVSNLAQFGAPGNLKGSFVDTSGSGIKSPDLMGSAANIYQQQANAQSANNAGLGNLFGSALAFAFL